MICPKCGSEIPDGSKECFICGEALARQQAPAQNSYYQDVGMAGNGYYQNPMNSAIPPQQQNPYPTVKGPSKVVMIGLVAFLCIVAVIVLVGSGVFVNKDGIYSTDKMKQAVMNMAIEEGQDVVSMSDRFDCDCTITISGKDCTLSMVVYVDGVETAGRSWVGTISFFGSSATIKFTNQGGVLRGKYNASTKTLSFDLDAEEQRIFGVDTLTFVKTE